jgi:predicted RNA binding protein YcfA (HicA-like mRNA interferase family)
MPKARQVLAALKRDGWEPARKYKGSHVKLVKNGESGLWAFHDGTDLHTTQLRQVASQFGYTLEQLRDLL